MELFISDLDNTLIYSYKRDIGADKVLVETKDGKELSFMTALSNRILREAAGRYCFVPSTTRSLEQYRRITFFPDFTPEYALAANGGILLRNGTPDAEWYAESKRLCQDAERTLQKAEEILREDRAVSFEIRRVDGLFVFTKTDDLEQTVERLRTGLREPKQERRPEIKAKTRDECKKEPWKEGLAGLWKEGLAGPRDWEADILNNGSKVYVVPRILNKGTAVKRLKKLTGADRVVAAGDSEFDIPMLLEADIAWFPKELDQGALAEHPGKRVVSGESVFSDQLLRSLVE